MHNIRNKTNMVVFILCSLFCIHAVYTVQYGWGVFFGVFAIANFVCWKTL